MRKSQKKFVIEHIDPLGQGVSKDAEDIFFVHNTLPGETGIADVVSKKKNILFGHLSSEKNLSVVSDKRVKPECPHFFECNGCHFLHTTHENEIKIKKANLFRLIEMYGRKTSQSLSKQNLYIHQSNKRFETRNRIQLHYDLSKKRLGLIGHKKDHIISVPDCLIGDYKIQEKIKELYDNSNWIKLVPKHALKKGHIEIKQGSAGDIDIIFNHPYSHGGFSQVNDQMNEKLKEIIYLKSKELFSESGRIFDLFGGSGNLSKKLNFTKCTVIDSYSDGMLVDKDGHQDFHRLNLYNPRAPEDVKTRIEESVSPGVILDPPRSGLKNIQEFFPTDSKVESIIYVSCNPATLFRDLVNIPNYKLTEVHLIDLFPCTYHYETICILKKEV